MKSNKAITIILIIILIAGFLFIYSQFSKMTKEGLACQSQPFIWGARSVVEKTQNIHMFCSCQIYTKDGFESYSFNEDQENPSAFGGFNIMSLNSTIAGNLTKE